METREHLCTVGGNVIGVLTMEINIRAPQKLKTELSYTQQSHLWVYNQMKWNQDLEEHSHVHCSIIHNRQDMGKKKTTLMCLPADEWRFYTHIHTHDGISFSHELEEYPVICNGWPFKTLC